MVNPLARVPPGIRKPFSMQGNDSPWRNEAEYTEYLAGGLAACEGPSGAKAGRPALRRRGGGCAPVGVHFHRAHGLKMVPGFEPSKSG